MITDCDGSIFLIGMNGSEWAVGDGDSDTFVSVVRLEQLAGSGEIVPVPVTGYDAFGDPGVLGGDLSARYGANMFQTPTGTLQFEITDRDITRPNRVNQLEAGRLRSCIEWPGRDGC